MAVVGPSHVAYLESGRFPLQPALAFLAASFLFSQKRLIPKTAPVNVAAANHYKLSTLIFQFPEKNSQCMSLKFPATVRFSGQVVP